MTGSLPAFFFGHGNPMHALLDNAYSRGWAAIGKEIPRPTAVLSVSTHWYIPGLSVMANVGDGLARGLSRASHDDAGTWSPTPFERRDP
jgi:hypothetical protein